ncbi:Rab family protein, partial [[Clostridium] scindens]|nr:Rab family protein [[Clostridium] scindens]
MKLLRYFKASCCFLKDIDFLKNAKDLVELNVFNNHIKHIEVLKGCEHMTTLDVGNNDIRSIDS